MKTGSVEKKLRGHVFQNVSSPIPLSPISVVVVNHNAGTALGQCLGSVLAQAQQVIVVDNGSSPALFARTIEKFAAHPRLTILRNPENRGFAAACNQGANVATEPALLFFNPDCIAPSGLLESLRQVLAADSRVGMAGGFLVNPDGSEQGGGRRSIPTVGKAFVRAFGLWRAIRLLKRPQTDFHLEGSTLPLQPFPVEAVSGACMLVRREAFAAVDGFDTGYFLHCEDLDLCLRLRQKGWGISFAPQLRVPHQKGVCGRDKLLFVEWHKHRGMLRFYQQHLRAAQPWWLAHWVPLGIWLRFAAMTARVFPATVAGWYRRNRAAGRVAVEHSCPGPFSVGVLGATSFVGNALLPLLAARYPRILAFSRKPPKRAVEGIEWSRYDIAGIEVPSWVTLCQLPKVVELLPLLERCGAKRLIALSSTSRFSKLHAADASERQLAESLVAAEEEILDWGATRQVAVTILRPTMIYDGVHDRNVAAIVRFVRTWRFYPVLAPATGLRQPVHVADVAQGCMAALGGEPAQSSYNLSGGEPLPYCEMVGRIFDALGVSRRLIPIPPAVIGYGMALARWLPGSRRIPAGIFARMNLDLVFDHSAAAKDLGVCPRKFVLPYMDSRLKRGFDFGVALLLLGLLLPLMAVIALVVRLTSPGPVIFLSQRVGRGNRVFTMWKFRTMRTDTPQVATHLLEKPQRFLTPIGGFLRRTSLDELPQLWCVIRGEMSLVGPRPALFNQEDLIAMRSRLGIEALRPGITGWAQCNGRDSLALPDKVAMDAVYLRDRSFMFDLKILCMTLIKGFKSEGVAH